MKVLVDYSTHCYTTCSSFSFDLTSCSVSLRAFSWLSTRSCTVFNVASQAADDHVPCVLQRTLIPYKIWYSARRMPRKPPNNSSDRKKQQMLPDIRRMSGAVFIFQQDSSPAHRALDTNTIELLRRETADFIRPDVWPANSPDLNPVDYRIWGLIQTAIRDIDDLKQRFTCVWAELKQSVVDKAIEHWLPKLRACIRAKGQHFEQLLN